MIQKIRHKGLKRLYKTGVATGIQATHRGRLRRILSSLDVAMRSADMRLPGYNLHALKGERKGEWSVGVSGNWRVTFRFEGTDVTDVGYEDYH